MRPGIVVHQEEPKTYCTSVGSDNGFKDFIPLDCHFLACRGLWYRFGAPLHIHGGAHQTCHAQRCCRQHSVLQTFSHLSQVLRVNILLSVKSTGHQSQTWKFLHSLANASWGSRCWAVSTGPTTGRCALRPPSWSLFLIVWAEIFIPVACWRSFCRARALLNLFLLAQRSRYRPYWWVEDPLQLS